MVKGWGRRWMGVATAAAMLNVSACGFLIFPERQGQPSGGKLDVSIVLLDAVGLLFGIIPGVVAFAVDLGTGCIYLPPEQQAALPRAPADAASIEGWRPVAVVEPGAGRERIAAAVAQHLAEEGRLEAPFGGDDIQWRPGATGPVPPVAAR